MNRIYRLVYNHALGLMQVASEIGASAGRGRSSLATSQRTVRLAPLAGALLLATCLQAAAQSLPQNGQIIAGSASINSSGNVLNVSQSTQSALIQWQNFNIGAGNQVNFNLPSSQAVSINQITGGTASIIAGQMRSNGQVFLLNPSGIAFTSGASVNVGGLLASTLNVGTPSLPVDGGPLPPMFQLAGGGTGAMISNSNATLLATNGGISLVGGAVSNNGVISAPNGSIDLVAAGGVLVTPQASSTGYLRLSFATTAASTAAAIGINDTGTLTARSIGMNAMVSPGLASHGINTSGTITANAIDAGDGVLTIRSNAPVLSSATITAATADIAGSSIDIAGGSISANGARLTANTGNVNVSGTVDADMIELTAGTVSQGSSGALQGAVKLDVQGTAGLGGVDNRIGAIAGTVGGDLTLVTRSALSNNGALQVTGSTRVTAADAGVRRDITLGNTGNRFGGLLFAMGNDIVLDTSGTLALGGIDARSLDANGAAITLAGTLLTTGDQLYRAPLRLVANSSVTAANSHFAGSVDGAYQLNVITSQATTFAGAIGSITPLQALNVAAGGGTLLAGNVSAANDIVFSGPLRLDADIGVTSTNGKVSLNGAVDSNGANRALTLSAFTGIALGGPLGATSALKSLQANAGVIELGNDISSSGNIGLDGSVHLTGNARLHSSGGAISSGGISSGTSPSNPDGYDLGLKAQSTLLLRGSIAARNIDIDTLLFSGLGITSKGALRIVTALPLIQGGAYLVGGTATFGSIGDIQLTNPGNRFGGVVSLDGVNATVNAQDLQLGNVRLGNALRLELGGSLSQAANTTLDVEGITTLIAGDAITLNGNANRFGGSVSVSGKEVQIQANDLLAFSSITATSLQATAARLHLPTAVRTLGLQRYDGAVTLLGDTRLASDVGQIFFNGSIDGAHAFTIERALDVIFNSTLGGSTALASLDTSGVSTTRLGGDISSSGTIALGGLSLLSTRDYNIASSAGDVRIGGAINGTADGESSLSLRAAGALDLQGDAGTNSAARLNDLTLRGTSVATRALQTRGKLDIGSGSGFAQGGTLTVGGDAVFSAGNGGNLVLDNAANSFGGKVALQGNQATLRAQSSLALDSVNLTQLTAYGNGSLSLANATVLGNASLDADALLFNNANISGVLTATTRTGNISQGSGTLAFGANSTLSASNDIVLGNTGNQFGSGLRAIGRDVTLTSTGALDIAQLLARDASLAGNGVQLRGGTLSRDLTVDSSSTITQTGALDVVRNSRFDADGDIALTDSGNRFLGSIAIDGNDITLVSAGGLQLADVRARGSLNLRATTGDIRQNAAVLIDGNSQLHAGGAINLEQSGNHFGGRLDIDAGSARIASADALHLGTITTTGDLRVSADAGLRLGGLINAGNVDLATAGIFDNRIGSNAISVAPNGRWHVNLLSPSLGHVFGALDSANTALWNTPAFTAPTNSGNRYVFAWQPTLTIRANNLRKIYGDDLDLRSAFTVEGAMAGVSGAYLADSVSNLLSGAPLLSSTGAAAMAGVSAAPYNIDISAGSLDAGSSGYALAFAQGSLQVDPRSLTITANNGGKIYGQIGGFNGFNAFGLVNFDTLTGVDLASLGNAATANVGNYAISASNAVGTGLSNYDIRYVDGSLSIGKAGLTITAGNGGKTYGQSGGFNGFSGTGLLNNDSISGLDLSSNGSVATANVGNYSITASNAVGTGLSNYDIRYVDGNLSIGKAGLVITANNTSKRIGQVLALDDFRSNGLLNGDSIDSVSLSSAGNNANAQPGMYAILAGDAQGARLGNYDISYQDGSLQVVGVSADTAAEMARAVVASRNDAAPVSLPNLLPPLLPAASSSGTSILLPEGSCTQARGMGCVSLQPE
ncbi:MBG domain-containing protein [Stenotrophomonas terrae]|uniref:MBG domain-containing protein n=1 Tax=Stenotrophomonas terrae TaxID=405446 RepID=UPI0032088A86